MDKLGENLQKQENKSPADPKTLDSEALAARELHHFHRDEKFFEKVQDLDKLVDDKYYTESITPRERNRLRTNKLKNSISRELPKTKQFIDDLRK